MQLIYAYLWRIFIANPITVRTVEGGSRRLNHLLLRCGYLGAIILVVIVGLLFGGGLAGEVTVTELAKAGMWVFTVVAYAQIVLVCLLSPIFMAGAISQEQAGKTYDILLTTPMSNVQIVLGTLLGRLTFIWFLLFSGLPAFAVVLLFGGVPVRSVFVAFALAALTALFVGSIAVLLSVMRAGGRKAVFTFVIAIAGFLLGAYVLDVSLLRRLTTASETTWITSIHPLLVLETYINRANYRPPDASTLANLPWVLRVYLGQPFVAFTLLTLLASSTMVIWSSVFVRKVGQGDSKFMMWLKKRLRIGQPQTGDGERDVVKRKSRTVGSNPIAWREANTRGKVAAGILAKWGFVIIGLGAAVTLLFLYHAQLLPSLPNALTGQPMLAGEVLHSILGALLLLELAVIVIVAIFMSAGSISREREDGTLDLLLTTPITPRQYIWGKLRGLISYLSVMIAVPVLTLILFGGYVGIGLLLQWPQAELSRSVVAQGTAVQVRAALIPIESGVLLAVILVPFVAACVATGMSWSVKAKGVLGAVVPSIAIMGFLIAVLGLCGWFFAENVPVIGPIVNASSPATSLFMLINPWQRVSGFADNPMIGRASMVVGAAMAAFVYGLIVYGMIFAIVRGFDHTVRKLSGTG